MRSTVVLSSARRRAAACRSSAPTNAHNTSLCNISMFSKPHHALSLSKQYLLQSRHITFQTNNFFSFKSISSSSYRTFPTTTNFNDEYEKQLQQRNKNIIMNPKGLGQQILPGNYVIKKHPKTGVDKKVFLEHALGYFWALKELELTNNKPILSNETIISATEAEKFPTLNELVNLHDENVNLPDFFTRNNRSKDANSQCTLVAISCKDFGAKLLPSWCESFETQLCNNQGKDADRYEVVRITINEGRIAKLLCPFIVSGTKKNVPEKDHANTLLYYGDAGEMRDILRMHNIYTSYVFLVDGIGRIRWAGSGEGSDDEVQSMIQMAEQLTQPVADRPKARQKPLTGPRVGKKVPNKKHNKKQ